MKHHRLSDTYEDIRRLSDAYEPRRRLRDAYDQNFKKKINFLIFGRFKRKNPRAVGSIRRILDRNVVVEKEIGRNAEIVYFWDTKMLGK